VGIPKELNPKAYSEGTYKLVSRLRDFLNHTGVLVKDKSPGRPKSRESFKVFYRPAQTSLSEAALRDLERADVQLVAATSSKKEAADRLIEQEINRSASPDPPSSPFPLPRRQYTFPSTPPECGASSFSRIARARPLKHANTVLRP